MNDVASHSNAPQISPQINRQIAVWLFSVAFVVILTVLVGGLTRLTDSGLSITEWRPVVGAMPPLSADAWHSEFEKYKQIPQYRLVNKGMSLAAFKRIYWWEWGHRLLGRVVGLVFILPFLFFWLRGCLPRTRLLPLLGLFVLGTLQGFMGWYMVKSGLVERVDVSQYRLAVHLGLAFIIFTASLWLALNYWRGHFADGQGGASVVWGAVLIGLILLQSLIGALVAGLDAGLSYNDWPFMDGSLWPSGLLAQSPVWRNLFENRLSVQFGHRLLAYALLVVAGFHIMSILRAAVSDRVKRHAIILGVALMSQIVLGILALIWVVPVGLAIAHQFGAIIALGSATIHLHFLYYR